MGDSLRDLAPLHSLGAFCFAVRRDVLEAVGAADEGYGTGPCWEMDYSARAARAGFTGVWVCAAYVHRPPLSPRRAAREERGLEASKRRYQDNLCALRLRGTGDGYEPHCRGEDCEHFAPRELIVLRRPLVAADEGPAAQSRLAESKPEKTRESSPGLRIEPVEPPLVSCLMPTADRRAYVSKAIAHFERQDYPRRELLIVDDGDDAIADLVPNQPNIRYLRLDRRMSLGAKRNLACEKAAGDILMHWDDDDWHAPHRISAQVAALERPGIELCGLDRLHFFAPRTGEAWLYRYPTGGRRWLAGGTFCFTRRLWRRQPFPDLQIGEDNHFAYAAPESSMATLDDPGLYVALIHDANTSRKRCVGARWQRTPVERVRSLLGADADDYEFLARHRDAPLVSAIMPTRDRHAFLATALDCFARQTYPWRELVVVDDGERPAEELVADRPGVRYLRLRGRRSVGAKRNRACEAARGGIIAHWDDDDWYAPDRLSAQVAPLLDDLADVSALAMRHVLTLEPFGFWHCAPELHARLHYRDLCPGTITYRRELWRGHAYPDSNCAEDVAFLEALPRTTRVERLAREDLFLCLRHGTNTWTMAVAPRPERRGWRRIAAPEFLPARARERYRQMAERR